MASNIIRKAIVNTLFNWAYADSVKVPVEMQEYSAKRFGTSAEVTKALVNPIVAAGSGLVNETLIRDEFVQAVFSGSILGKLQGLIEVPALTRVAVESSPVIAPFVGEYLSAPGYQGNFSFVASGIRKVAIVGVVTEELLRLSGDAAEGVISGQLQRALSRGIDKAFVGSQSRDAVSPNGLGAVAVQAASFNAGVLAFTGDLSKASVIVNPLTAVTLRSPTEQSITAAGGNYGGLPVITSYAAPVGKLIIVDGSRVLAYIGGATVDMSDQAAITMDDGSGTATSTVPAFMFQEGKRALLAKQYIDFEFVPGAAVEVTLS
ncbi:hypothetical protein [Burkholderia sp. S171]|uniref:hypothetical protein n=1 Tax=Burkholderia sp. S171 TaxID=1641860 RepID=UPI00131B9629|nr:hypothetical protein [Burkholderia sp. S171]